MKTTPEPTLAENREEWIEALSGDDQHSIMNQIQEMIWDAAAWRVVNEARRLAPKDSEGGVQLNNLMFGLLDKVFFESQLATVRRLTDREGMQGKRGVCSLVGLIADISKHRELLTREAIFDAEGLEYNYEPIQVSRMEYVQARQAAGEMAWDVPEALRWERNERRHKQIDRLTGVESSDRQLCDILQCEMLANLKKKIEKPCEDLIVYATKFIAHAATPESRETKKADEIEITLSDVWEAHKVLCEVARFLAICVLGGSCPGILMIPAFDQFKHIDKALIDASQIAKLESLWQEFDSECYEWGQWGLDEYEAEFGNHTGK